MKNYINPNNKEKDEGMLYQKYHVYSIKKKLIEGRQRYQQSLDGSMQITDYWITQQINSRTKAYATLPTIRRIFKIEETESAEATSINQTLVVELCKLFNLDLNYVLAPPDEDVVYLENSTYGYKMEELSDENYHGKFHCYRLSTSSASGEISYSTKKDTLRDNDHINHSELVIKRTSGKVEAVLTTHNINHAIDGKNYIVDLTLRGTPILFTKTNNIQINFISDDGELYTLFFDYQPFDSGSLYYREAILLSSTKGTRPLPLISKMIITREQIVPQQFDYLRGLLSLNVNTVIISQDKLLQLAETDVEIGKFIHDFDKYIELWTRPFCIIPENIVANNNPHSELSNMDIQKILIKLRNHSYSLAQVIVGNAYKASVIGKEIQQKKN